MAINLEYLEFKKDEIPVSKKYEIEGSLYTIEVQYNDVGDFYTLIAYDSEENPLVSSKMVYMGNVFGITKEGLPQKKLMPLSIADLASEYPTDFKVNDETFDDTVRLYLV